MGLLSPASGTVVSSRPPPLPPVSPPQRRARGLSRPFPISLRQALVPPAVPSAWSCCLGSRREEDLIPRPVSLLHPASSLSQASG